VTFLESVDEILSDRFSEGKRASAKRWYNHRYGRIWSQEPWTFKMALVPFTVAADATTVSLGTLQRVHSIKNYTYAPSYSDITPLRPEDYLSWASGSGGVPDGLTIINNTIHLTRPYTTGGSFVAVGELKFVPLVDDSDEPLLPEEFHMAPVHGAISEGLRLENDPSWEAAEADLQTSIMDMRKSYLSQMLVPHDEVPSWPYGGA
jgi:hypothetical protein